MSIAHWVSSAGSTPAKGRGVAVRTCLPLALGVAVVMLLMGPQNTGAVTTEHPSSEAGTSAVPASPRPGAPASTKKPTEKSQLPKNADLSFALLQVVFQIAEKAGTDVSDLKDQAQKLNRPNTDVGTKQGAFLGLAQEAEGRTFPPSAKSPDHGLQKSGGTAESAAAGVGVVPIIAIVLAVVAIFTAVATFVWVRTKTHAALREAGLL